MASSLPVWLRSDGPVLAAMPQGRIGTQPEWERGLPTPQECEQASILVTNPLFSFCFAGFFGLRATAALPFLAGF